MKKLVISLYFIFFTFILVAQTVSSEEMKLYNMLMDYRRSIGLPTIPLSKSLTLVAQWHTYDLVVNKPDAYANCNPHSWSNKGKWSSCCYTSDHAQANCMWEKPSEITNYRGNGFEIAHGGSNGFIATAETAFNGWRNSSGHNAVIINSGNWNTQWQAIGISIRGGYAVVWFGNEPDPQ